MSKPQAKRLDPRNPWVLDTRELPRGPGSLKELQRAVPAPDDLGSDMLTVPVGEDVELELSMQSVSEGIWVSGTVKTRVVGECGRCLEPLELAARARFSELYAYPDALEDPDPDDVDAQDFSLIVDEMLDLEPVVRDALLLGFPLNPLCRAECSGLCSVCGVRIDDLDDPEGHTHETIDPRWAALRGLTEETPDS